MTPDSSTITPPIARYTFTKAERLCGRKQIELLFGGNNQSIPSFPLRVVYMEITDADVPASVLISVPKKRLKRAVQRNRVKRQIREAYRHHKTILTDALVANGKQMALAFIWLDTQLYSSLIIEKKVVHLLQLIVERTKSHE